MLRFSMLQEGKVLIGAGAVNQIGELITQLGYNKTMVVCDIGILKAGLVDKAVASLTAAGHEAIIYDKVLPDPPAELCEKGYDFYKEQGCDSIVAIGGGSSIDTAKGINILRYNEGPILRFADPTQEMKPSKELIAIPTTAGTGSELSDGLVLTNGDTKMGIGCLNSMADYIILDPELFVGLPAHITASTGMDVLAHASEAYTGNAANCFIDFICEKVIQTVAEYLPVACSDPTNLKARERMALASSMKNKDGKWKHLALLHQNQKVQYTRKQLVYRPLSKKCSLQSCQ